MSHQHPSHDIFENRNQFQLERIILFTDAVFAIAITLLILEIKVPEAIHHVTRGSEAWSLLKGLALKFFGFFFSFILIGVYWMGHHRMFGYVINYNHRLLWLNLLLLMSIVLLPFTTALAFESMTEDVDVVFIVYMLNHILIGILFMLLWRYISNPKRKLAVGLENRKYLRYNYWRSLSVIIIFTVVIVLCFFNADIARYCTVLCAFTVPVVNRIFKFKG